VELKLEAAVEIGPQSIGLGFTRWLHHLRPRSDQSKTLNPMAQVDSARASSMVHPGNAG